MYQVFASNDNNNDDDDDDDDKDVWSSSTSD